MIRYRLSIADLERHHFIAECRIEDPAPEQRFSMPSWIPGSYLLREYARYVVGIEAESAGSPIEINKVDKGTWCCTGAVDVLTVTATIYALDRSVRGAYLDRQRAYFNGTCVFLLPEGRDADAVELVIEAPSHAGCVGWRVATGMAATDVDARGFGSYRAEDYDELIDHPFEIGEFASVEFVAAGVPHKLVVAGRFDSDLERVATDLSQLCTTQIDFFGRPAPFDTYTFLGLAVGDGYGGLEHRASSSLIFRRDDLPKIGETGVPRNYQRFLGLASHEYFHSWHIKRSKPAAFMPYRLDRRNQTRLLWVFEGITTYYQERFLLLSGLLGIDAYLRRVGESLTRVYRTPGRFRQSIAESSFDAWDSLYKPEPHSPNTGISYYSKGALVALALDLNLRRQAPPTTLDEILKAVWARYGSRSVGLEEDAFERLAIELGGAGLGDFFDRAVRGTEDPPLAELFADFGLTLCFRPASNATDTGGTDADLASSPLALGASFSAVPGAGLRLLTVFDGGPAEGAGLIPGDVIVALDDIRVTEANLAPRLARYAAGDKVRLSFFRDDMLLETALELAESPHDTCFIVIDEEAATAAVDRRRDWLGA